MTYFAAFQVPSIFAICKIQMMKRLKTDNEYIRVPQKTLQFADFFGIVQGMIMKVLIVMVVVIMMLSLMNKDSVQKYFLM